MRAWGKLVRCHGRRRELASCLETVGYCGRNLVEYLGLRNHRRERPCRFCSRLSYCFSWREINTSPSRSSFRPSIAARNGRKRCGWVWYSSKMVVRRASQRRSTSSFASETSRQRIQKHRGVAGDRAVQLVSEICPQAGTTGEKRLDGKARAIAVKQPGSVVRRRTARYRRGEDFPVDRAAWNLPPTRGMVRLANELISDQPTVRSLDQG